MHRKYMIFASVAAAVMTVAIVGITNQPNDINSYDQTMNGDTIYIPSDITKANPNLVKAVVHTSVATTDIGNLKGTINTHYEAKF